jgi:FkbM family methyltransferase
MVVNSPGLMRNAALVRNLRRARTLVLRRLLPIVLRPRETQWQLQRVGSSYGGWWIPASLLCPGVVAYCAGAGEDISFDLALVDAGCRVTTFDPTPRAIAHVESLGVADESFRFVPIGWWDTDTDLRFYTPRDPSHVSHSVRNLQDTTSYFVAPVKPVSALASELGDERLDLVKMDIEGAEVPVIYSLLAEGPRPKVLCVEFDQPQPLTVLLRCVKKLRSTGFVLVKIERWNYTFVYEGA